MPTRHARAPRERAHSGRTKRSLYIGAGIAAAVAVFALAAAAGGVWNAPAPRPVAAAAGDAVTCGPVQSFPSQGGDHIAPDAAHPAYTSNPPTSGWHWATPQDWGIFTTPQVQEQLVHNLEHGGIVIQYKDLAPADVEQLTSLVRSDGYHRILAPYPGLPGSVRVAFTAWTHLQTCTGIDETAIQSFTNAWRDRGPERVP